MKTIARNRTKYIAGVKAKANTCKAYDADRGDMVPTDPADAWSALETRPRARLVESTDGTSWTVHVHSNLFYKLTITPTVTPAAAAAPETKPAPANHPTRTYREALAAANKAGAAHADDASLMAMICEDTIQLIVGAVSPQLVWEGAQKRGLTTKQLVDLAQTDFMAVEALQWI